MKTPTDRSTGDIIASAIEALRQGEALLAGIDDRIYTRKLPTAFNASIGGHYRHCLDHFRALLEAAAAGDLNYDHRERGTLVENDRFAALNATRDLCLGLDQLDPALLARRLDVTCKTSYATGGSQVSPSTVGREIMYTVAHAVHHYALIGTMARIMDVPLPDGFGVAPSTLEHHRQTAATHSS
jgi:hypothetical protein